MNDFVNTLEEALAAIADPACFVDYHGTITRFGATFHLIGRKGYAATHGYTAEQLIAWVDQELF